MVSRIRSIAGAPFVVLFYLKRLVFEQVQHCLGAPLHWGPGANCPCCPPPPPPPPSAALVYWSDTLLQFPLPLFRTASDGKLGGAWERGYVYRLLAEILTAVAGFLPGFIARHVHSVLPLQKRLPHHCLATQMYVFLQ